MSAIHPSHRVLHHGRLGVAAVTADYGATVGIRFTPDDGQAAPSGERWTRAYLRDATNRAADDAALTAESGDDSSRDR